MLVCQLVTGGLHAEYPLSAKRNLPKGWLYKGTRDATQTNILTSAYHTSLPQRCSQNTSIAASEFHDLAGPVALVHKSPSAIRPWNIAIAFLHSIWPRKSPCAGGGGDKYALFCLLKRCENKKTQSAPKVECFEPLSWHAHICKHQSCAVQ